MTHHIECSMQRNGSWKLVCVHVCTIYMPRLTHLRSPFICSKPSMHIISQRGPKKYWILLFDLNFETYKFKQSSCCKELPLRVLCTLRSLIPIEHKWNSSRGILKSELIVLELYAKSDEQWLLHCVSYLIWDTCETKVTACNWQNKVYLEIMNVLNCFQWRVDSRSLKMARLNGGLINCWFQLIACYR